MALISFTTLFVKSNSLQFYEKEHSSYSASAFDCLSYKEKLKTWQTGKPYDQKVASYDTITIMVHTQANTPGGGASGLMRLGLYDIHDNIISLLPMVGTGQQNAQNVYYPNGSTTPIQLDSFLFQFQLGTYLLDSGQYYLKFTNTGSDGTTKLDYYSEPILLLDDVSSTIVISGQNFTNRESQKILINGWAGGLNPVFSTRVEGYVNLYKPKSVYIQYLQQQYLSQQLSSQNFRQFTLQVGGSVSQGVPDYMLEKVVELLIMDSLTINDGLTTTPYVLDMDSDTAPKAIGAKKDPESSNLVWDKYELREKYPQQNAFYRVVDNGVTPFLLFTGARSGISFVPYAVFPWVFTFNGVNHNISKVQGNGMPSDEASYLTYLQATFAGFGAAGTVALNGTTGDFTYTPAVGETVSLPTPVKFLTKYWHVNCDASTSGSTLGYQLTNPSGVVCNTIVNFGDGSPHTLLTTTTTSGLSGFNHTYTAGTSSTNAYIFHDDLPILQSLESGSSVKVFTITGYLAVNCQSYYVDGLNYLLTPFNLLSLAPAAANLQSLAIYLNSSVTAFNGTIFATHLPLLKDIRMQQMALSTAQIDLHINNFVANSWTGITGGSLSVWGNTGAASSASLTSRNTLIAAGWTVTI